MATGNTWCKKGLTKIKAAALVAKLGRNKRFTENRSHGAVVHNRKAAIEISDLRTAAKAARRLARS